MGDNIGHRLLPVFRQTLSRWGGGYEREGNTMEKNQQHERKFGSRWGFILASVGSAVGMANVWGFPSKMGSNGGGAFLLIYLLFVFLFSIICNIWFVKFYFSFFVFFFNF